jgi:hypothetical protein
MRALPPGVAVDAKISPPGGPPPSATQIPSGLTAMFPDTTRGVGRPFAIETESGAGRRWGRSVESDAVIVSAGGG